MSKSEEFGQADARLQAFVRLIVPVLAEYIYRGIIFRNAGMQGFRNWINGWTKCLNNPEEQPWLK